MADLTYVKTHTGWVYVAFVVDVFSRFVVGWQTLDLTAQRPCHRRTGDGHPRTKDRASTASSITATGEFNISQFATPSAWPKPAS